jgi:hypothetical protein
MKTISRETGHEAQLSDAAAAPFSRRGFLTGAAGAGLGLAGSAAAWGAAGSLQPVKASAAAQFTPTSIVGPSNVCADLGFAMLPGTLDANLFISASGDAEGDAKISWSFGRSATITIEGNNVVITSDDGSVLDLQSIDLSNPNWLVDGEEVNPPELIGPVLLEIRDNPDPARWSPHALNLAALVSLWATPVWQQNTEIAMLASASPGFWCKVSCAAIAGIVVGALVAGCAAAVAACAGATTVTLGGVAVPCVFVAKVCTDVVIAGIGTTAAIVVYEAWLAYVWG